MFVSDGGGVLGWGLVGGDIFGGSIVVVVVEMAVGDLKLEVGGVVRIVWSCVDGELYFLQCLSQSL